MKRFQKNSVIHHRSTKLKNIKNLYFELNLEVITDYHDVSTTFFLPIPTSNIKIKKNKNITKIY